MDGEEEISGFVHVFLYIYSYHEPDISGDP